MASQDYFHAEKLCETRGWDFDDTFKYQFLLTEQDRSSPGAWNKKQLSDWFLYCSPDLPVSEIRLADNSLAGYLLGIAVAPDGRLVDTNFDWQEPRNIADQPEFFEAAINNLAGRYVVILFLSGLRRFYVDPTGSLGAVYEPNSRNIGSSIDVVLDRDLVPDPHCPIHKVLRSRVQCLHGHTCDASVLRCNANFYLDLKLFTISRHWPTPNIGFRRGKLTTNEAGEAIAKKLSLNMKAMIEQYSCALPISGGMDSRLLLACSVGHHDKIDSFFVHQVNWSTSVDVFVAQQISAELGLELKTILAKVPDSDDTAAIAQLAELRDQFKVRSSYQTTGISDAIVIAATMTPETDLVLRGNLLEMARANKWSTRSLNTLCTVEFGAETLFWAAQMSASESQYWESRYKDWVKTVPQKARLRLYDLAHVELWMPSVAGAGYYAYTRNFYINPANDREIIRLMMKIPPSTRKRKELVDAILQSKMAALNQIPYKNQIVKQRRAQNTA